MTTLPMADADNPCGGCAECCVAMPIQWEDGSVKWKHTPCRHLEVNLCGIHDTKPALCQNFLCLWRIAKKRIEEGTLTAPAGFNLARLRPDVVGGIVHETDTLLGDLDAFMITETRPGALAQHPELLAFVGSIASQVGVVIAVNHYDDTRKILVPEGPGMTAVAEKLGDRLAKLIPEHADAIGKTFGEISEGKTGKRLAFHLPNPGTAAAVTKS